MAEARITILDARLVGHETFQYVEPGKPTLWLDITELKEYAQKHGIKRSVEIDPEFCAYAQSNMGVEEDRVEKLCEPYLSEPVIMITKQGGDLGHIWMVDGHHRIIRKWRAGETWINAYIVVYPLWEPFVIHGVPEDFSILDKPRGKL